MPLELPNHFSLDTQQSASKEQPVLPHDTGENIQHKKSQDLAVH